MHNRYKSMSTLKCRAKFHNHLLFWSERWNDRLFLSLRGEKFAKDNGLALETGEGMPGFCQDGLATGLLVATRFILDFLARGCRALTGSFLSLSFFFLRSWFSSYQLANPSNQTSDNQATQKATTTRMILLLTSRSTMTLASFRTSSLCLSVNL